MGLIFQLSHQFRKGEAKRVDSPGTDFCCQKGLIWDKNELG
jgi:hypothetical protein